MTEKQPKTTNKEERLQIGDLDFEEVMKSLLKVKPAKNSAGSKTPKKKTAKKAK
jgi:hypothetical protein